MIIGLFLAYFLLLIDQISKILIFNYAPNGLTIIPNTIEFNLVFNKGAAFSFMENNTLFLAIVSTVASIVVVYMIIKHADFKTKKLFSISLAMILAGAFGNLIDRYLTVFNVLEGVVDFIDLYLFGWHFPGTFNLADAFLCIGVVLLIIDILFFQDKRESGGYRERTKN